MKRLIHEERLRGVHPQLVLLAKNWVSTLPFDVLIVEGVRTDARQRVLWAQGRSTPGPIVTHAEDVFETPHGLRYVKSTPVGFAIDAVPCTGAGKQPTWQDHQALALMGNLAEDMGLEWGGNWAKFPDADHFQVPGWRQFPPVLSDPSPPPASTA